VIGAVRRHVEECESTQLLLSPDEAEGTVVTAGCQRAGRGRLGRRWESPAGASVLMSTVLRPPTERRAAEISLVAGVATALAVEQATGLAAQVKWPNDVMLDRGKVAGILAEMKGDALILGIGVNVNQTREQLPPEAIVPPASLRTVDGRERDVEQVLAMLLGQLDRAYAAWLEGGLEAVYDDLGSRDFLRGRRVTVDGVAGTAEQIQRDGRLLVLTDTGDHLHVESGEVHYDR
jgi:BirA family biotin operon repressor/biotin-[acetyl-CoA-carboxylase] ligase